MLNDEQIDTVDDSETSVVHYEKDTKDFFGIISK